MKMVVYVVTSANLFSVFIIKKIDNIFKLTKCKEIKKCIRGLIKKFLGLLIFYKFIENHYNFFNAIPFKVLPLA